jgi:hypothetical protein
MVKDVIVREEIQQRLAAMQSLGGGYGNCCGAGIGS